MSKIKVAVVGYGNIGRYAIEAVESANDFELVGIVRRNPNVEEPKLKGYKVVANIEELGKVDVAILAAPTREIKDMASKILALGIATVDSFDIHTEILDLRNTLSKIAKENNTVAVVAAGWDPGSDSVVRTLMEAIVPKGVTYTNFGPGMSMGHTVAVKSKKGVKNALSMTIPVGTGIHRRMVYIELENGTDANEVINSIKTDAYFINDETHVMIVDDVDALKDMGHGVTMQRKGVSGQTQNQLLSFDMRINNPALTAQILVACARAAMKLSAGAYTMLEIPVIDLLPGDREKWIAKLC